MPTYLNYASLLEKVGRMNEAEMQYKLALKANPNDKMGRLRDAQKHFQRTR